jgi:hypothetical protein
MLHLPASRTELKLAGWTELETRPCRKCETQIEFWRAPSTVKGKAGALHPLEVRPEKNWTLDTHFKFCPFAKDFSRKQASATPRSAPAPKLKQRGLFDEE